MSQRLVHFLLVEEAFLRLEWAGEDHPDLATVGAVNTEYAGSICTNAQVKKPCLDREPRRIGQEPHRERILEGFFDFPQSQRAVKIEGRISPIELHVGLIVNKTPILCVYIVFTHSLTAGDPICQLDLSKMLKKSWVAVLENEFMRPEK
jgi:hypothetical protein